MDDQMDRTYGMSRMLQVLRIIGLWPWSAPAVEQLTLWGRIKRNYCYLLHLPITFAYIGLMWVDVMVANDLESAGQVLYMAITEIALIVKILNIWYRRTAAWQLMHELRHDPDFALRTPSERTSWHQEQRSFERFFFIYILFSLGVVSSACFGVLFLQDYELPFAYYVPFEWRNARGYWYAYGYCVLGMVLTCISNVTMDALGCYFLLHIALLYRLLGMRLQALKQLDNDADIVQELRQIFQLHQRVRSLSLVCQTIVSPYVLSQIVLSAFILCFSGYRLQHVNIRANPGAFFAMLQFVGVMILQIFLPCYFGNEITVHAHQLTNEVYNTNWLQCTPPTRKLLNAYMEFLKRPVKIRAGDFFEIGLPIFGRTINNAYSFFALLLNVSK